jgi:hypothetical protein
LFFVPVARAEKLPSIHSKSLIKAFAADRKACCVGSVEKIDNVVEELLRQTKQVMRRRSASIMDALTGESCRNKPFTQSSIFISDIVERRSK